MSLKFAYGLCQSIQFFMSLLPGDNESFKNDVKDKTFIKNDKSFKPPVKMHRRLQRGRNL